VSEQLVYYAPPRQDRFTRWVLRAYERAPRWSAPLAVTACMGGAVAYTLLEHPTDSTAFSAPSCILKLTTGFDCPGCGGTRAAWYLLHGNVPQAARHHAVFVFAVPFLLYMYVAWAVGMVTGRKLPMLRLSPRTVGVFLGVWFAFSVLRNLPYAPFTRLYV
jgi:Protein of unknown function (DUF2752)